MLSRFAKLLLTSTAVAPVLLTYAWVAYQSGQVRQAGLMLAACVVLVIVCLAMLRFAKGEESVSFVATTVEAADRENMAFLLLYILPLFTSQFSSLNWQIWVPTILIFAATTATGYSYHFNPLLGMMGWHFYKVGTKEGVTYVIITRKKLQTAFEKLQVVQLTEYIVLDCGE